MSNLVILCGGLSSRFGADKSLCEFEKKPLSLYQFERLQKYIEVKKLDIKIYLCIKNDRYPLLDSKNLESKTPNFIVESKVLSKTFLDHLTNSSSIDKTHIKKSTHSPLYGIYASLLKLQSPCVFMSVDTPFLSFDTIKKLLDSKTQAFIKTPLRSHFLPSKWDISSLDSIKSAILHQEYKLGMLMEALNFKPLDIEDEIEFFNINTKANYKEALELKAKEV
ncbi:hypothetical protein BKH43_04315 [Helicobacter sp. 13S00401-1]|uniref:NTP transferase domain-containing protein n=1 Tax=Helicobacter sp. 13S00401-1 TaxID=1905758 RepID=UPI000BA6161A|nr:NTP transferase domain-containing protein [Helicobacter sp. 13S00401-1]PAF50786.1 hypothetical protein BKH43_04315 [Helicobacter sp. 13S00401-1]